MSTMNASVLWLIVREDTLSSTPVDWLTLSLCFRVVAHYVYLRALASERVVAAQGDLVLLL